MSTPVSPIVSGLVNGFSLANMLHRQRTDNQRVALEQQRLADQEAEQRSIEERQNADLAMRLNTIGARPMTPSDDLEAKLGQRVDYSPVKIGATGADGLPETREQIRPSLQPSDISSRLVKAGGKQYVMPSEADREARLDENNQRGIARDTAKIQATSAAKLQTTKDEVAQLGVPLTDDAARVLNLPKGTKVLQEHLDDYMRAYGTAKANEARNKPRVIHSGTIEGSKGLGVYSVMEDGTVKAELLPQFGSKPYAPDRESPNTARLIAKEAQDQLVQQTASGYATRYATPAEAETALKADSATDPFVKKNYLGLLKAVRTAAPKPKPAGQMTAEEAIAALNGGTPAATPKPAAAAPAAAPAAPKKKANGDQIRAYAKRRGISFQAAVAQAEKENFDVTGLKGQR